MSRYSDDSPPATPNAAQAEHNKEPRSVRLVRFLDALAALRKKSQPDILKYDECLWLADVPHEPECYAKSWTCREEVPPAEGDLDLWLEVKHRPPPEPPAWPPECERWLSEWESAHAPEPPRLLTEIVADEAADDRDSDPERLEVLHLEDFPEIVEQWSRFLEGPWSIWKESYANWRPLHDVYVRLFRIHSKLKKAGEQLELMLGIGLLTWRVDRTTVRRHVLTTRASLEFDDVAGIFQVRPTASGSSLKTEFDMLPPAREPPEMWARLQGELESKDRDPWDVELADDLLKIITNSLDPSGLYKPETQTPREQVDENLCVEFAPAVFLRKRSTQGVHEMLKEIGRQLGEGEEPPPGWKALTGDLDRDSVGTRGDGDQRATAAEDFLLPLHTNEEQEQILRSLKDPVGALVQGPPGTGKSHTIANLICHLLATGNRVLITSQKSRALEVLDDKLPESIRPLCVSFVGSGVDEQKSLERSVRGICAKQDSTETPARLTRSAEKAAEERGAARRSMAETMGRMRDIGEFETRPHVLPGYRGTAARIAERLASEQSRYDWLIDPIQDMPEAKLLEADYAGALDRLRSHDHAELIYARKVADLPLPQMPEPTVLARLFADEREAAADLEREEHEDAVEIADRLSDSAEETVNRLFEALDALEKVIVEARNRPQAWIRDAFYAMLTKQDRPWKALHESTAWLLDPIAEKLAAADARSISGHEDVDRAVLRRDAATLLSHVERVGHARMLLIRGKKIRRLRYITSINIDGTRCDNKAAIESLVEHLHIEEQLRSAWNLWLGKASATAAGLQWQHAELAEHQESLGQLVEMYERMDAACTLVNAIPGVSEPAWPDDEQRWHLLNGCRRVRAQSVLRKARRAISETADAVRASAGEATPDRDALSALADSVKSRDLDAYKRRHEAIVTRRRDAAQALASIRVFESLGTVAPMVAEQIIGSPDNSTWTDRVEQLPEAMRHAYAACWLRNLLGSEDSARLSRQLEAADRVFRSSTAKEATLRSWAYCLDRLEDSHRMALVAWQHAIKSLGKGTGKMAGKWKRAAREELQRCQTAIPAWVMPLHRVFESVRPKPGMFDYIIVDEASQSGPDALPLFYLGKKIIIVGDDKQISPTHFVNLDVVESLIKRHLTGFDRRESFSIERSLFDHGELHIGNRVVLREHFRCMPEIIRFSNNLMYTQTPLEPLRQFAADRLPPLKHLHVSDGTKSGSGSNAINKPEAEAIATAVVRCCRDPKYTVDGEKLTMGVISLQGGAQAEHIESILLEQLGPEELEARDLMCGDAYTFQGSERDVIFLSLVAAGPDRIGSLTAHSAHQRFNVAASRARNQMWLFHSVMPGDLSSKCVRRKLLEYFLDPDAATERIQGIKEIDLRRAYRDAQRDREPPPEPFDSWFEVEVALELVARGYNVVPQFPAGGYRIDLVVDGANRRLAVECDGDTWHGPEQHDQDLYRQRKLERAGWTFVRIRASAFHAAREEEIDRVLEALAELGIRPAGVDTPQETKPVLTAQNTAKVVREDKPEAAALAPELDSESVDTKATEPAPTVETEPPPTPKRASPLDPQRPNTEPSFLRPTPTGSGQMDFTSLTSRPPSAGDGQRTVSVERRPIFGSGFPRPADPKTSDDEVADGLEAVVRSLGSTTAPMAFERFALLAGHPDRDKELEERLNDALRSLLGDRRLRGHNQTDHLGHSSIRLTPLGEPSERVAKLLDSPSGDSTPEQQEYFDQPDQPASVLGLEPHTTWAGGPFSPPLESSRWELANELLEIISFEAPVRANRAYQLHASAAGLKQVGTKMRKAYNQALHELIRRSDIEGVNELGEAGQLTMVVRPSGSPSVRLRTAGDRATNEIPPSELAAVMSLIRKNNPGIQSDSLFKKTVYAFGFKRLRQPTRLYLGEVKDKLLRDTNLD